MTPLEDPRHHGASGVPNGPDGPDAPNAPDAVVRSTRAAALAALLALISLGLAWELWLAPTGSGTLALKVVPLVLCVAGLLRHRMYTFRWLSLLIWLYFMEGVVRAVTERGMGQGLAVAEVVLSVVLFVVSGVYIRWRLRNGAALAAAAAGADKHKADKTAGEAAA